MLSIKYVETSRADGHRLCQWGQSALGSAPWKKSVSNMSKLWSGNPNILTFGAYKIEGIIVIQSENSLLEKTQTSTKIFTNKILTLLQAKLSEFGAVYIFAEHGK